MTPSRWKQLRYRLEWAACAALAWGVTRLPRKACARLAHWLGAAAYYLDARGRNVAIANITTVLGRPRQEAARIARASYQSFARNFLDLLWAPRLNPANWRDYIEVEGTPLPAEGDTRGAVYICIHWGNFEWASMATGFSGQPCHVVAETFKNPHLSSVFNSARQCNGHTIIPQENSMIRFLKQVRQGRGVGMLADLTLRPDQAATIIHTFGRPICTTFLHGILAERGGARIIPVHGIPLPDGRTRVVYDPDLEIPPGATATEIAQRCWDHFQPRVEAAPHQWMWAYKHWRYRPRAAAPESYPFYANPSGKFEKLLSAGPPSGKHPRRKQGRKSPPAPPAD